MTVLSIFMVLTQAESAGEMKLLELIGLIY
jgi:hypothetical protein